MLKAHMCITAEFHSQSEAQGRRKASLLCILGALNPILLHEEKKLPHPMAGDPLLSLLQETKYLKQNLNLSFFRNSFFTMMELIKEKLARGFKVASGRQKWSGGGILTMGFIRGAELYYHPASHKCFLKVIRSHIG